MVFTTYLFMVMTGGLFMALFEPPYVCPTGEGCGEITTLPSRRALCHGRWICGCAALGRLGPGTFWDGGKHGTYLGWLKHPFNND